MVVGSAEVVQDDDRIFAKINLVRTQSLEFRICIIAMNLVSYPEWLQLFLFRIVL